MPGVPPNQKGERQKAQAPRPDADSAPGRLGKSRSRSRGASGHAYLLPLGRCAPLPASLPGAAPGATQCSGRSRGTSPVHVTAAWRRPAGTPREGRPSAPRRRRQRRGLSLLAGSVPLPRALRPAPPPRPPSACPIGKLSLTEHGGEGGQRWPFFLSVAEPGLPHRSLGLSWPGVRSSRRDLSRNEETWKQFHVTSPGPKQPHLLVD